VPRRTSYFRLTLAFFGLTLEHRKYIFDQIHQIVFHGQGGYSFTEVYELPIHIRKYVFHQIKEYYDKQNKQQENPEELAKKIKGGQIEVPDYAKGKKLSYG
jgi:hypothetical protein